MNKGRRAELKSIAGKLEKLKEEIEFTRMDEETSFENLPESLQESERGEAMQEAMDDMVDAMDNIEEAINILTKLIKA